jgi:hypothetical protein
MKTKKKVMLSNTSHLFEQGLQIFNCLEAQFVFVS